jgi:putative transposase
MSNYTRYYKNGGCYFFTVVLNDRSQNLLTANIQLLRQSFAKIKQHYPFKIDAIVILPDHIHSVWTLPKNDNDFSTRWRLIKSAFSRSLSQNEYVSTSRENKHERGIWQRRFWEHFIKDQEDYNHHIDYIHFNPVKHGYLNDAYQWPYSSLIKPK